MDIPENAMAWLRCHSRQDGPISPAGFDKRIRGLVKKAGLTEWPHNALRHSAASYHYAKHQNAAQTIAMLGKENDDVLFTHYRALVKSSQANKFYLLSPPMPAANVVQLQATA